MLGIAWLAAAATIVAAPEGLYDIFRPVSGPSAPASAPATTAPSADQPDEVTPNLKADDLDPLQTFLKVVDRYRQLGTYRDSVKLVQVTQRDGEDSRRQELTITCEIAEGELHVTTPSSQVLETLGVDVPAREDADAKKLKQEYAIWLAPHMAMKYADRPLAQFRAGVKEGFTATDAQRITENDKRMLHVELKSAGCVSEDCPAEFDLYVNAESMLIERIEGHQTLPDGADLQTTLHISPVTAEMENEPVPTEPAA